jgi:hypothetical protein
MILTDSCQRIGALDDERCGASPDFIVVTGCVHEHISETGVCARHHQDLLREKIFCLACWGHHRCRKVLISSRPAGESTAVTTDATSLTTGEDGVS